MADAPQNALPLLYKDLVPLSSVDHASWKTRQLESAPWLQDQHAIPVTVDEFASAQRFFPIIFSAGDSPVPLALLGFDPAVSFALASIVTAVALGAAANVLIPSASLPDMHHLVAHRHAAWEIVCATVLAGLLARSLLAMGPRPWFAAMAHGDEQADDGHGH